MARFNVGYTKLLYQVYLLLSNNVRAYHKNIIAKCETPNGQLSVSFSRNDAGNKIVKSVDSFTEILNYTVIYVKIQTFTTHR